MEFLGFIVILPIAALAVWSIYTIYHWLRRLEVPDHWWKKFAALAVLGVGLGLWWAFSFRYTVSNERLQGFPIPVDIISPGEPGTASYTAHMPLIIHISIMITDFLSGVAICLAPMGVAAFVREYRAKKPDNKPPE